MVYSLNMGWSKTIELYNETTHIYIIAFPFSIWILRLGNIQHVNNIDYQYPPPKKKNKKK